MSGYTKLFGSIVGSTIWREPHTTRIVWITLLAMKDSNGVVECSIPGLADFARVTLDECEAALKTLKSPDKYSRTPDHDGRRIEDIDGGWRILNHDKYQQAAPSDQREYWRKRKQDERDRRASRTVKDNSETFQKCHDTLQLCNSTTNTKTPMVAGAPGVEVLHETRLDEQTRDTLADAKAVKNAKAFKASLKPKPVELPAWMPREVWDNFLTHRHVNRSRHGPFTADGERIALKKLTKLRDEGHDPIALVEEAIVRGWASIFAPKESGNGAHSKSDRLAETLRQIDKA